MQEDTTTEATTGEEAEQSTTSETIERSAESLRSDVAAPAEEQEDTQEEATEEVTTSEQDEHQEIRDWAEKAGYDPQSDPKALKALRDTQKKLHESTSQVSELKKSVEENEDVSSNDAVIKEARILNFYNSNPEARQYDKKMGEIYSKFTQTDPQFAENLLTHMDTLLAMAKAEESAVQVQTARQQGREEANQQTRKAQASSAPKSNAVSSAPKEEGMSDKRVREIIANGEYDKYRDEILTWERTRYGL